jgi:F-box-like
MAMSISPHLIPYTTTNDPLPSTLRPIRDVCLEEAKAHVIACDERICQIEAKIEALGEGIEELHDELQQATGAKHEHQSTIRTLTGTTSVLRRVPPEIIASIISFLVESADSTWWRNSGSQRLHTASSVSRLWRHTALSTPSLWRLLVVELASVYHKRTHQQAWDDLTRTFHTWFSRGGEGAGMDLRLDGQDMYFKARGHVGVNLIVWFNTSDFSFIALELTKVFTKPELVSLLKSNSACFRSTRTLSFQPFAITSDTLAPGSVNLDVSLPSLRSLKLASCDEISSLALSHHPTLTKLELVCAVWHSSSILAALRGLPNLEWLAFESCTVKPRDEGTPFTHHSLRRVTADNIILGKVLALVFCPALERFDIWDTSTRAWDTSENVMDATQHVGALIQRSLLTTFTLGLYGPFPAVIINTLLSTSNSKVMTLDLHSLVDLPLDPREHGTQLIIPSSVKHVQCSSPWMGDERDLELALSKLSLCLEAAIDLTLTVKLGDDSAVRYVKASVG